MREHWFEDGTVLGLPGHSRAAQLRAVRRRWGPGSAGCWVDYVDSFADDWEVLRRAYFENAWDPADLSREVAERLDSREMLHKRLRKTFKDERLRLVAAHPFVADGHDLANVPAWAGLVAYLEQRFGAWTVTGGMASLTAALTARMATRGVTSRSRSRPPTSWCGTGVRSAVATTSGAVDADVVVCAVDPRRLPALAPYVERTMPADAAGGLPRRPRRHRCATCRTRWSCTATRCSSSAPAAGPRPAARRGRCTAAAGSPRTS